MASVIEIRGIHPVEASEPVHLVDIAISGNFDAVDWSSITQPDPALAPENWQVPYDEQELPRLADGRTRGVFFFHYLDVTKPLQVGSTLIELPRPTSVPVDLATVMYEEP
jgi:hypothetical protein